jgi:hypothetical protein
MTASRLANLCDPMDSVYDVPEILEHSRALGHVPIIDVNPRTPERKKDRAPLPFPPPFRQISMSRGCGSNANPSWRAKKRAQITPNRAISPASLNTSPKAGFSNSAFRIVLQEQAALLS